MVGATCIPSLVCAAPLQAALYSWKRGDESEVSEYNVQQQVYHRPAEDSMPRASSHDPILPPYKD